MIEPKKPKSAIILLSYRQEKFVAEAVRGALAQEGDPIEIVISDDASPDDTWQKIENEVAGHTGPHRIILNRNPVNLGLMGNLLKAVSLSTAEYLIMAAGDDISESFRVRKVTEAFAADDSVMEVVSNGCTIDAEGKPIEEPGFKKGTVVDPIRLFADGQILGGAKAAYRRELFELFPPPDNSIWNEDAIFCHRAAILGQIVVVHDSLLRYRKHGSNVSNMPLLPQVGSELNEQLIGQHVYWRTVLLQQRSDVTWAIQKALLKAEVGAELLVHMDRHILNLMTAMQMLKERNRFRRLILIARLRRYQLRRHLRLFVIAFSPSLYIGAINLWRRLRSRA